MESTATPRNGRSVLHGVLLLGVSIEPRVSDVYRSVQKRTGRNWKLCNDVRLSTKLLSDTARGLAGLWRLEAIGTPKCTSRGIGIQELVEAENNPIDDDNSNAWNGTDKEEMVRRQLMA
jgi:hypothetical protein